MCDHLGPVSRGSPPALLTWEPVPRLTWEDNPLLRAEGAEGAVDV